jgi:hypothetical protein
VTQPNTKKRSVGYAGWAWHEGHATMEVTLQQTVNS